MNIIFPMGGVGSRMKAISSLPKHLIEIDGKPVIKHITDNFSFDGHMIFCTRAADNTDHALSVLYPGCTIVNVPDKTNGTTETLLYAKQYIDNTQDLMIAFNDSVIKWDFKKPDCDGAIAIIEDNDPKWSFVEESGGYITRAVEKDPISNKATAGQYYWKRGSDFVKAAEAQIKSNNRYNNEFYLALCYNHAVKLGLKIETQKILCMQDYGSLTKDLKFHQPILHQQYGFDLQEMR